MQTQEIVLSEERHVRLTAYLQEVNGEFGFAERPAILVLPGGGYAMCSDREADPVALAYMKAGYQAFILRYTVKQYGGWPAPLDDYEQTMDLIEENAEKWHVCADKIAVVGFSAGGHLTGCAATIARHRPAAAILVYPAILQDVLDMCQPGMPSPAEHVSGDTCPCFMVATRDDKLVPIINTLAFEKALAEKNIAFESYIYSFGDHGFSTGEKFLGAKLCVRAPRWVDDSIEWLKEVMGEFTAKGFNDPAYPNSINGNNAPFLSATCTLNYMNQQSETVRKLLEPMYAGLHAHAVKNKMNEEKLMTAVGEMTVQELLTTMQVPPETIAALDAALRQIPNKK